jgi:hypothetical protein
MKNEKAILWSLIEKYDNISEMSDFCDAISRFIQDKQNGNDIIVVYRTLIELESADRKKIDSTIGSKIEGFLFSI